MGRDIVTHPGVSVEAIEVFWGWGVVGVAEAGGWGCFFEV